MGAFIPEGAFRNVPDDDPVQTAFLRAAEVFPQFGQADVPVAVNDVYPAVIIEQQGGIMVDPLNIRLFPGPLDAVRREKEGFRPLMGDENRIEPAVMIPEGRCPHAVTISRLFVFQDFTRGMLQGFIQVRADFPPDQVMGFQDDRAGKEMHGRTDHVIGIADADDVRIRIIHPGQGIEAGDHFIGQIRHRFLLDK